LNVYYGYANLICCISWINSFVSRVSNL